MRDISAIILCGGQGTRLRSVVSDRPKVLAEVAGRPFLSYLLDQLIEADVGEVVLSTGFMAEIIAETFGDHYRGLKIHYAQETEPLGTGGAIKFASQFASHETLLVMNGDSLVNESLVDFLADRDSEDDATFLLVEMEDASRFGSVAIDDEGRITEFREKCASGGCGFINAGIYVLSRSLVDNIPAGSCSFERDVAPSWLGKKQVRGFPSSADFIDIGIPESYSESHAFMRGLQRA